MSESYQQATVPPSSLRVACASDLGRVRQVNEDSFLAKPPEGLFIVSDGIGGHQAGDLASQVVTQILPGFVRQRLEALDSPIARTFRRSLREAIQDLSLHLRQESQKQLGLAGMGATVVALLVRNRWAHIANMGDSRAYRLRNGRLEQLTEDHSVVAILLRRGKIDAEEAKDHPARGRLSRFVGMDREARPDVRSYRLKKGDRFLLCTDGLTDVVSDEVLRRALSSRDNPEIVCRELIDSANEAGGVDNITTIVVDWLGTPRD